MTDSRTIFHVCRQSEWQAAVAVETYAGSSQDVADGFIHFSAAHQVVASVAKHRAGQTGLVLLAVDPARLGPQLVWEASRGGELFPHLYGPLPVAAVTWAADLPLDAATGRHVFPVLEG